MLLVIEANHNYQLIKADKRFQYRLAYTYVIGSAFWNFVGAGVFGGANPGRCDRLSHGVALLRGFSTPSLLAQGGQRLPHIFNIDWGISRVLRGLGKVLCRLLSAGGATSRQHEHDRQSESGPESRARHFRVRLPSRPRTANVSA